MGDEYSVLMSVYYVEQADRLRLSVKSMAEQTAPPAQMILVCDGSLTEELEGAINDLSSVIPTLEVIRQEKRRGLGQALRLGLSYCKYDIVVRMDSDDVANRDRCEKQIAFMKQHELDLCSAGVVEFTTTPTVAGAVDTAANIIGCRILPETHDELLRFARKRNPMNHPCVAFRKSMATKAGGYRYMPFFEDYDLWARMILAGAKIGNHPETLLYMRVGESFFRRRSGLSYCRHIIRFWKEMRHIGFCSRVREWSNIIIRCAVSILPMPSVRYFYRNKLRKKYNTRKSH